MAEISDDLLNLRSKGYGFLAVEVEVCRKKASL